MKKILISLFISIITISSIWAESNTTIKQIHWEKETDRSISNVPSVTIQNEILYIVTGKQLENFSIEIQGLWGNIIMQQRNMTLQAENAYPVYISNLPKGYYTITLIQGENYAIYSLMK